MSYKLPLMRHVANPILTPEDMPFRCYTVMNSGATMYQGKVVLLLRVEYCDRRTYFHVATSDDGVKFTVNPKAINYPLSVTEEVIGPAHRFDMRITHFEEENKYYIFHAAWMGTHGCGIGLCETTDFVDFKPLGHISPPSNRNGVLFPRKINGRYCRLDRPQNIDGTGIMWVSWSDDMDMWGHSLPILQKRNDWNKHKIGAGCIPIETEHGWLLIYHATAHTCSTENYHLGAMLVDLNEPHKIISDPQEFILAAEKDYECIGQTPNVVFTGGAVIMPDGKLNVYYGGADTRMCLAQTTVAELTQWCLERK